MVIAGQALVSAGQDNSIRVWNFNQQAGIFMSQVHVNSGCTSDLPHVHL
jgi:hypothetical protein